MKIERGKSYTYTDVVRWEAEYKAEQELERARKDFREALNDSVEVLDEIVIKQEVITEPEQ
jgi:hypothetical protein